MRNSWRPMDSSGLLSSSWYTEWPERKALERDCVGDPPLPSSHACLLLDARFEGLGSLARMQAAVQQLTQRRQHVLLCSLSLRDNGLTEFPDELPFPSLRMLDLATNRLGGSWMRCVCGLPALRKLDISSNGVTDAHLRTGRPGAFPRVFVLRVGANQITDASLVDRFPSLTKLALHENPLVSAAGLPALPELTTLDLDCCRELATLALPPLPKLRWLLARECQLTSLSQLPPTPMLQSLLVAQNQLATLAGLPLLPLLELLVLAGNRLTSIDGIHAAESLRRLDLSENAALELEALGALRGLSGLRRLTIRGVCVEVCADEVLQEIGAQVIGCKTAGSEVELLR